MHEFGIRKLVCFSKTWYELTSNSACFQLWWRTISLLYSLLLRAAQSVHYVQDSNFPKCTLSTLQIISGHIRCISPVDNEKSMDMNRLLHAWLMRLNLTISLFELARNFTLFCVFSTRSSGLRIAKFTLNSN